MPTIENTQKCLLTPPMIQGHRLPQWLPGKNPLSPTYWKAAKLNSTVARWVKLGMIKIDMSDDMPDPDRPPSPKALAAFGDDELAEALADKRVPVKWHPAIEDEIKKRKSAELAERLKSASVDALDPRVSGSLKGLTVEKALPLIAQETNPQVLNDWRKDNRKALTEAIGKRLADLEPDDGS